MLSKPSWQLWNRPKVEMRPVKFGEKLPPYGPCPSCKGTGLAPKPVKISSSVENVALKPGRVEAPPGER
jgi:hypothetical protein